MATGSTALAQKFLKKTQAPSQKPSPSSKKNSSAKSTKKAKSKGESFAVRTKMADGKKRNVFKAGSGLREDILKMVKSGKTIESIAKHFGKENKDISWYVSKAKKNGDLPKNFEAKREPKS